MHTAVRPLIASAVGLRAAGAVHLTLGYLMSMRDVQAATRCSQHAQEGVDVLGGYLSPVHSAYGKPGLASNLDRIEMCRAATGTSDWLMTDAWEAEQATHTRTLTVLRSVRERLAATLGIAQVPPPILPLRMSRVCHGRRSCNQTWRSCPSCFVTA